MYPTFLGAACTPFFGGRKLFPFAPLFWGRNGAFSGGGFCFLARRFRKLFGPLDGLNQPPFIPLRVGRVTLRTIGQAKLVRNPPFGITTAAALRDFDKAQRL